MKSEKIYRFGMVIDLDRCNGCGNCTMACAVENNITPAPNSRMNERNGVTWLRVFEVPNGGQYPESETVFIPMMCQQCAHETPCVTVCPQNAVELDPATGIVAQIPQRCLGCRYCMTACPYHARYFNWWDPEWPAGLEKQLNPDAAPRMRGVVEKCNFCHGRMHAAKAKAAASGSLEIAASDYIPACVESCPVEAIVFCDLYDPESKVSKLAHSEHTFRFLERLGTEPKVRFHSERSWVRAMAENSVGSGQEEQHG
jgi:molybdopterin-containing oxidoreductase family iron-sulfur binding subunit